MSTIKEDTMRIRKIEPHDNPEVAKIIRTSLEELGFNQPGTAYFDPQLDYLFEYYQNRKHSQYWVMLKGKEIIGGIGIDTLNDVPETCELQKLYLKKEFQGQGLSKKLMTYALSYAKEYYLSCYLETHTELEAAHKLYEQFGFKQLEQPLVDTSHGSMNLWMVKRLDRF